MNSQRSQLFNASKISFQLALEACITHILIGKTLKSKIANKIHSKTKKVKRAWRGKSSELRSERTRKEQRARLAKIKKSNIHKNYKLFNNTETVNNKIKRLRKQKKNIQKKVIKITNKIKQQKQSNINDPLQTIENLKNDTLIIRNQINNLTRKHQTEEEKIKAAATNVSEFLQKSKTSSELNKFP